MTKHVRSLRENLRVTAGHRDRSVTEYLGDSHFYRLKTFLKGFIAICSSVPFGKSSALVKDPMELKLEWPLFSRVNNFLRERNYLRTLQYFRGGKKKTVLG